MGASHSSSGLECFGIGEDRIRSLQRARDTALHEANLLMQERDAERQRAARAEQIINQRTLTLAKEVARESQRANKAEQERENHLRRAKRAEAERDAGVTSLAREMQHVITAEQQRDDESQRALLAEQEREARSLSVARERERATKAEEELSRTVQRALLAEQEREARSMSVARERERADKAEEVLNDAMQRAADIAAAQLARAQADVLRLSPVARRVGRSSHGQRMPSPADSESSLGQGIDSDSSTSSGGGAGACSAVCGGGVNGGGDGSSGGDGRSGDSSPPPIGVGSLLSPEVSLVEIYPPSPKGSGSPRKELNAHLAAAVPGAEDSAETLREVVAITMETARGILITYSGTVNKLGKPHGKRGLARFSTGDCFEGDFDNGKWHGVGTYRSVDGVAEVGTFDMYQPTGEGAMWSDDRETAWRMRDGKIVKAASGGYEEISIEDAALIAEKLGVPVPPPFRSSEVTGEATTASAQTTPRKADQGGDGDGSSDMTEPEGPDSPSVTFLNASVRALGRPL